MPKITQSRASRALLTGFTAGALLLGAGATAQATNTGTVSGENKDAAACTIEWTASAVLDTDLANNDATYPNLMVDLVSGDATDYTNGGYIKSVSPHLGNSGGLLEVTHFYTGTAARADGVRIATANTVQVWRPVFATKEKLQDVVITLEPPAAVTAQHTLERTAELAARPGTWGGQYADYAWSAVAEQPGTDLTELRIAEMPAGAGTAFSYSVQLDETVDITEPQVFSMRVVAKRADCVASQPGGAAGSDTVGASGTGAAPHGEQAQAAATGAVTQSTATGTKQLAATGLSVSPMLTVSAVLLALSGAAVAAVAHLQRRARD